MLGSRLQLSPIQGFQCFLTSLLCSRLRLFHILFVTSLFYLLRASIVSLTVCCINALFSASLSVCYVIALFSASIVPSADCYVTILPLQGSNASLSVYYVIALFSASAVSSPICCVTIRLQVSIVSL